MRIDFECSGGFAGLHLTYHGSTDDLPELVANELLELIKISRILELQQSDLPPAPANIRDAFSYRLSLSEGDKKKSLSFTDAQAPTLQPLVAFLQKLAIEKKHREK